MVDGKPLCGTVSMLKSKFARMGSPKQSNAEVPKAIEVVVEATRDFGDASLLKLAMLLGEALAAEAIVEFTAVGEKMQALAKEVAPALTNQAKVLCETIPAFMWRLQSVDAKAVDHIRGCQDAAQYYVNRILQEAKQKSAPPAPRRDADSSRGQTTEYPAQVAALYKTLLDAASSEAAEAGAAAPAKCAPAKAAAVAAVQPASSAPTAVLQGNRWIVEKARNAATPVVITPESMGQAVVIEDCENVRVRVAGKVALVSVSRCKRLFLEVGDIVSNVEAMNTESSELVLTGRVPTVVLDSTEGIRLVLSEASRDTQILTSKCAEVNLVVRKQLVGQQADDADELAEIALPFQFKSVLGADGTLTTEAVKHAGA